MQNLGARLQPDSQLILVGGSALALLGSPRLTIDIDFIGDDVRPIPLHRTIMQISREMQIHVELVPLESFVPSPEGNEERVIHISQYCNLEGFVADPLFENRFSKKIVQYLRPYNALYTHTKYRSYAYKS